MEEEKKKKKAYCKPEMHVEEFTPNEYIAVCDQWSIECISDEDDTVNGHIRKHTIEGCKTGSNQIIKKVNGTYQMTEKGGKILPCTITTPSAASGGLTLDYVKSKQLIKWETSIDYTDPGTTTTVTWHHKGYPVPYQHS